MGNFDLGDPFDFARATLSDASGILQLFTGRDKKEWDVQEASFNGIRFHVFQSKENYSGALRQVSDQGGRRKVKYQFPYKDGQTTDDLGQKPENFEFDILLHGSNYMQGFLKLMNEFKKPTPGDLMHPIRGKLRVVVEDYTITHSSDSRKAVMMRVTFGEHNFSVGDVSALKDASVKSALVSAIEFFGKIDGYIANIQGALFFARDLIAKITAALNRYKSDYSVTLTRLNRTFNSTGTSVDIPGLLPVNTGGVGPTSGGTNAASDPATATFPVAISPSDPFAGIPVDVLTEQTALALAVTELTKEVNTLRETVNAIIEDMKTGEGAFEFYDDILGLMQSAVAMQQVLERGVQSSSARIVNYTVPHVMSLREVAFANGLNPDRVEELDLLNQGLLSVNYIAKDTVVQVPTA